MITPLEIQNREFDKSFRGYNKEEVDRFLEGILRSYEDIYRENIELKDKLGLLSEQISKYDDLEETLKTTLVMAQSTADDVTKAARKKSELIIEEAEIKAKEAAWKSELKVEKVLNEYNSIKKEMIVFRNKYISFLQAQLASVEEFSQMEEYEQGKLEDELLSEDSLEYESQENIDRHD